MAVTADRRENGTLERPQMPFRVLGGFSHGFQTTELHYESDVLVPGRSTRVRMPMVLRHSDPPYDAVLELMRIANDLLEENAALHKEYQRDQKTIARLQGMIETLENRVRGHQSGGKAVRKEP
jgi:hypothetical protein